MTENIRKGASNMKGEFMSLDTAKKLEDDDKKYERLRRDKNMAETLYIAVERENQRITKKSINNLETIEAYLIQSIDKVKKDKNIDGFIAKMEFLLKSVQEEKRLIKRPSIYPNKISKEEKEELMDMMPEIGKNNE